MKSLYIFCLAAVCAALMLTACGTSEFGMTENTEKRMVITAERAAKDDFFLVGSLTVDEGEQITISSDLEKGSVRVEIFRWGEEQDADTLPETGGEATLTANLHAADGTSGTVEPGNYSLKAVCLEKATGTVTIEVVPAE